MSVTANGWSPVTFPPLRAGWASLWKAAFGANADTDPQTPDGLEISMLAGQEMLAFDTNTGLWGNSFFRSSAGISTDRILDLVRFDRLPATFSSGVAIFYGAPATAIPVDSVIVTADTAQNRFDTDAATAIGADDNSDTWIVRVLAAESGVTYTVQVDAQIPSAYVGLGGDDVVDIATGLRDDINNDGFATATLAGLDSLGQALIAVDVVGGPGNITTADDSASTVIDEAEAIRTGVEALTTGPVAAAAGTLQALQNPIVGVLGVTNDAGVDAGVDEESDDAYKARWLDNIWRNTSRTDKGMQADVSRVTDVVENSVVSNRSVDPVDAAGRPIGSVENIVLVEPAGSQDAAIAQAIATQIPAGIRPYGLRSFGLGTTPDGEVIEVFATDVEELYLHLDITVTAGEGYPVTATEAAIQAAVANYLVLGQLETSEGTIFDVTAKLIVDRNALRTAMNSPINATTQNQAPTIVILTDTTANPGDAPAFVAADQFADERQIIRADANRIAVTVLVV